MLKLKAIFRETPWPHLYIEEVFDEMIYPQLLAELPPLDEMVTLPGYDDRMIYPLDGVGGFWGAINEALTSPELTSAFAQRLGVIKPCYPQAAICRDLPGYNIGPHTDATFKVMTFIMYLPGELTQQMLGTRLLQKKGGEFIAGKQLGFFPNVGLAFKVTKDSWHEVGLVPPGDPRDTIQVCYFNTPERRWI